MNIWAYDKTFEGFLSLVFECYDRKTFPEIISGFADGNISVFPEDYKVDSDKNKAGRVWKGLQKKTSDASCQMLFSAFLSEIPDIELRLLNYIRTVFDSPENIELNFGNENTLELLKLSKKVSREAHRTLMFVRFQKTADDIYYASFDPKYNVLPLSVRHFERRFADQKWIIYDTNRNYGFYYDLENTQEVIFTENSVNPVTGQINEEIMAKDEKLFQELWKTYFDSTCIRERINPKLHMQFLPKRFWKYLPEKQRNLKK